MPLKHCVIPAPDLESLLMSHSMNVQRSVCPKINTSKTIYDNFQLWTYAEYFLADMYFWYLWQNERQQPVILFSLTLRYHSSLQWLSQGGWGERGAAAPWKMSCPPPSLAKNFKESLDILQQFKNHFKQQFCQYSSFIWKSLFIAKDHGNLV